MQIKNTSAGTKMKRNGKAFSLSSAATPLFTILLALTFFLTMAFSVNRQYRNEVDATYASLRSSMYSLRSLISLENRLEESFSAVTVQELSMYADLTKPFFDYFGVSKEKLTACGEFWEAEALYYYPDEGRPITSDNADPFPLGKSQARMLKTVGSLFQNDFLYSAVHLKDGWLYMKWDPLKNIYSIDFPRIAEACPSRLCIIENATGNIVVTSDEPPYDFLDGSMVSYDEERNRQATDGIQAGYLRGKGPLSGAFLEKSRLLDRYSVFVYEPFRSVIADTLWKTLPIHGLVLLCFLFIWLCARKLREKGMAMLDKSKCLRLGRKSCFSLPMMRHLLPLLLVGILAWAAITAYLPLLTNYISHNAKMEKNLQAFIREIELNDEEWEKLQDAYQQVVMERISMIDYFSDLMGEDFTQDVLVDLAQRMGFSRVVIYDRDGVSRMSTSEFTGYAISQNPDDAEYSLWNLLRNADTGIIGELPDKSGFYAASRRQFGVSGLIYVTLPNDSLVEMKEQTDIHAAFLRINTGTYAKMYTAVEAPETFLWATASSSTLHSIANTLPENVLMNRYCGTQNINGYAYYLNTMTNDNHVLISVERLQTFFEPIRKILNVIVPEALLLSLLILCSACICPCPAGWVEKEPAKQVLRRLFSRESDALSPEEQELRLEARRKCSQLLWILCGTLVILYFIDALYSHHPISDYLFNHQWQREPSIFSLTTIILSVLFLAFSMKLLKFILKALSSKMDSRAETFGDLVLSIIQFLLTVVVVIYSLHELGVDTRVILTSAGVVSLIIGYGSQSIVSDLVSGIFLIMEDQVRIGEIIEIAGFMGKVEHIGLRTTRVSNGIRAKVISNSNMVAFDNLSRNSTPAYWSIGLPQYIDPEKVKALLVDNTGRFREVLGDKVIRGPVCMGMNKVLWGGQYVLLFALYCDIANWTAVRSAVLEITYKILQENDIKPISGELLPV